MRYIFYLVFLSVIGSIGYVMMSKDFEQDKPNIKFKSNDYWNLKQDVIVDIEDSSGIKYYKCVLRDGSNIKDVETKVISKTPTTLTIGIKPPKFDIFFKAKRCIWISLQ